MRSKKEIEKVIAELKRIKPGVRQFSMFGDNNHAAIDAQIEVLENLERYDEDEVYRMYDPMEEEGSRIVLDNALDALHWAEGEEMEEGIVGSWMPLYTLPMPSGKKNALRNKVRNVGKPNTRAGVRTSKRGA